MPSKSKSHNVKHEQQQHQQQKQQLFGAATVFMAVSMALVVAQLNVIPATTVHVHASTSPFSGLEKVGDPAEDGTGIDFYMLIDKSASISDHDNECREATQHLFPETNGKDCWALIVQFAFDAQYRLAQVTQGYQNSTDDSRQGLRLSLTTFHCKPNGEPVTRHLMDFPTGNIAAIEEAFHTMSAYEPTGGKCMSEGLDMINEDLAATVPATRPKAVMLITDGVLNDEQTHLNRQANEMRSQGALAFSVAIGTPSQQANQNEQYQQLLAFAGAHDRIFRATDASSLDAIVDLLAALTLTDFSAFFASLDGSATAATAVCLGESPEVAVVGQSLDFVRIGDGAPQDLICEFRRAEWPQDVPTETSVAYRHQDGTLRCNLAGTFEGAKPWSAWEVDPEDHVSDNAKLAQKTTLQLVLKEKESEFERDAGEAVDLYLPIGGQCIDFSTMQSQCAGQPKSVTINGDSIETLLQMEPSSIDCIFDTDAYQVAAEPDQGAGAVSCTLENAPASYQKVKLVATIPSQNDGEPFTVASDIPLASDQGFCASVEAPSTACWRVPVEANFTGSSIDWLVQTNRVSGDVLCYYVDTDTGESSFLGLPNVSNSTTEEPAGDGSVESIITSVLQCSLPEGFSEGSLDGTTQRHATVALVLNPSKNVPDLKPMTEELSTADALYAEDISIDAVTGEDCVRIEAKEEKCIGQQSSFRLTGKSIQVVNQEAGPLNCDFYDRVQGISASFPVTEAEDSTDEKRVLECIMPAAQGDFEGVNFDLFALVSNAVDVYSGPLNVLVRMCLDPELDSNNAPSPPNLANDQEDNNNDDDDDGNGGANAMHLDVCWGAYKPRMTFSGDSAPFISTANPVCRFHNLHASSNEYTQDDNDGTDDDAEAFGPFIDVPSQKLSEKVISCDLPEELTRSPFDEKQSVTVRLMTGLEEGSISSREVKQTNISLTAHSCLEAHIEQDFSNSPSNARACWGVGDADIPKMVLNGATIHNAHATDVTLTCQFIRMNPNQATETAETYVREMGSTSIGHCDAPQSFFNQSVGEYQWNITVLASTEFEEYILKVLPAGTFTVDDGPECFSSQLVDMAEFDSSAFSSVNSDAKIAERQQRTDSVALTPVCWGTDSAAIAISGPSAEALAGYDFDDNEEGGAGEGGVAVVAVYCVIDGEKIDATRGGHEADNAVFLCELPNDFAMESGPLVVDVAMYVDITEGTNEDTTSTLEIMQSTEMELKFSTEAPCVQVLNVPDHVCMGSSHRIHVGGNTIQDHLAPSEVDTEILEDLKCHFTSRHSGQDSFVASPTWVSSSMSTTELSMEAIGTFQEEGFETGFYECASRSWNLTAPKEDHLYEELILKLGDAIVQTVDLSEVTSDSCVETTKPENDNEYESQPNALCHVPESNLSMVGETVEYLASLHDEVNGNMELQCDFRHRHGNSAVPAALNKHDDDNQSGAAPSVDCTSPGWQPWTGSTRQYEYVALLAKQQGSSSFTEVSRVELEKTSKLCVDIDTVDFGDGCGSAAATAADGDSTEAKNVNVTFTGVSLPVFQHQVASDGIDPTAATATTATTATATTAAATAAVKCQLRYDGSIVPSDPTAAREHRVSADVHWIPHRNAASCMFTADELQAVSQVWEATDESSKSQVNLYFIPGDDSESDNDAKEPKSELIVQNIQGLPCAISKPIDTGNSRSGATLPIAVGVSLCALLLCCGAFVAAKKRRELDEENARQNGDEEEGNGQDGDGNGDVEKSKSSKSFKEYQDQFAQYRHDRDSSSSIESTSKHQEEIPEVTEADVDIEAPQHISRPPTPLDVTVEGDITSEPVPTNLLPRPAPHAFKLAPVLGFVKEGSDRKNSGTNPSSPTMNKNGGGSDKKTASSFTQSWRRSLQAIKSGLRLAAPRKIRFGTDPYIDYCDFGGDVFELSLDPSKGLGISLGWTDDSKAVIDNFRKLSDGSSGALEKSGLLALRDQLLAVNGKDVTSLAFSEIASTIRELLHEPSINLRFKRSELRGNISCSSPMKIAVGEDVNVESNANQAATVQELGDAQYLVSCESSSNGLGTRFGMATGTRSKIVVVEMNDGPLQSSGRVQLGHELRQVNGQNVVGHSLAETLKMLQAAQNTLTIELVLQEPPSSSPSPNVPDACDDTTPPNTAQVALN